MSTRFTIAFLLIAGSLFLQPSPVRAGGLEGLNYAGRLLGFGWSDGYHAQDYRYPPPANFQCGPSTLPAAMPPGPVRANYGTAPGYAPRPAMPLPNQQPNMVPNQGPVNFNGPQGRAAGLPSYAPMQPIRPW